ncbi:integrase [Cucumis melo var. makuwa]|uniref:Integrase n=1 Tax=Cucumis melo var. makuwa TaxID=1194695 RepID=A0A5D3DDH4_CUCMM|nr:integrase [Cucumis melo var. makuwa]TYK21500.1 integrase [Cucumis melo var. makuwa]
MVSNGNMLQPQLPRFSGKNFNQWSIQMKVLYGSQELWDIVERGYVEVENQSELTNQQLVKLRENSTSAKAAWDILDLPIKEQISLRSNGEEVGDQRVVEKILRKAVHVERGGHGGRGGGRNYDKRSGANSKNSQESSSLSQGRGSRRGRGFGRNQGGGRGNFSHIQCFNCRKYDHFQADCWALKNRDGNTTMNMHKEQKKNDEGILFLACSVQNDVVEPTWYLDSDCSNHMTGNRSIFVTLDESFQSEVKTGDNTKLQVKGQGDILMKTKKGTKRVTNVFYVSGLKHNLLSIGQLLNEV